MDKDRSYFYLLVIIALIALVAIVGLVVIYSINHEAQTDNMSGRFVFLPGNGGTSLPIYLPGNGGTSMPGNGGTS